MINIYYIKATKLYLELATHAVPTFSCLNFMLNLRQERKPSFHKLTDEKRIAIQAHVILPSENSSDWSKIAFNILPRKPNKGGLWLGYPKPAHNKELSRSHMNRWWFRKIVNVNNS